jgi:hypothetical protein
MSTIYETIYTLEEFNKWRRGNKTTSAPEPFELGVAIGDAVRLLRELFVMQVRAEKAESELAAAKKDLVIAHDGLDERDRLRDENKLLAAALAAERKKVRVLRKALENVKDSICRDIPDGYSQPCVDQSADECDKIIEEAMKETSK